MKANDHVDKLNEKHLAKIKPMTMVLKVDAKSLDVAQKKAYKLVKTLLLIKKLK